MPRSEKSTFAMARQSGGEGASLTEKPTLNEGADRILRFFESLDTPPPEELGVASARHEFDQLVPQIRGPLEDVDSIFDRHFSGPDGSIDLRVYRGIDAPIEDASCVVYFHGGGWVLGGLESHDDLCRWLANSAECVVVCVDYRLAPEHPFPAGFDDCYAALEWVSQNSEALGINCDQIAVGGDSAGGCLAAAVSIAAKKRGGPRIAAQLLIYPNTDAHLNTRSMREFAEGFGLTELTMRWFRDQTAPDSASFSDWRLSPLLCDDVSSLPTCIAVIAEADILRDEGLAFLARLDEGGVSVDCTIWPGQIHGFVVMGGFIEQASQAAKSVGCKFKALVQDGSDELPSGTPSDV